MSTVKSVSPVTRTPKSREGSILNIARMGRQWFVELAALDRWDYRTRGGGRIDVTPEIGRAMLAGARREGQIDRVHRWGACTTWHLI